MAAKHPMQPVVIAKDGIHRFKANAIVQHLLNAGPFDMNKLALMAFDQEDREQFAQLIGYSVSGFGDLSYASEEMVAQADAASEALLKKDASVVSTKTIWKFPFSIDDEIAIDMPKNAHILDVQVQNGVACLWAIVDPKAEKFPRHFRIYGTGHPLDNKARSLLAEGLNLRSSKDRATLKAREAQAELNRMLDEYLRGRGATYSALAYIGTFQMANGALVWHLFEWVC